MRWARGSAAVAAAALITLGSMLASGSGARASLATANVTTETLRAGVTLERIEDPSGPQSVRVLIIDPSHKVTLRVVTAGPIGDYALTSQIGKSDKAIAAINGDFSVDPGRPVHPIAGNGNLMQSGVAGIGFALAGDKSTAYFGADHLLVTGYNSRTAAAFTVAEWNTGRAGAGQIAGFTTYGARYERPKFGGCYVRLKPGRLRWTASKMGVYRRYSVLARRCSSRPLSVKRGTTVLASRSSGAGATAIKKMNRRHFVRLSWSMGWPGVDETIGGMPLLVDQGLNVAPPASCGSYLCSRNPRTGIAYTGDGKILLVTVDGRSRSAAGMTLNGFAKYLIDLGAVEAVNLDGGGGTTMWVHGEGVVNQPADPWGERPVTNAILVVPDTAVQAVPLGAMGAFFAIAPAAGTTPIQVVSPAAAHRTASLDASDPGSTGGLFDAFGSFGSFGQTGNG